MDRSRALIIGVALLAMSPLVACVATPIQLPGADSGTPPAADGPISLGRDLLHRDLLHKAQPDSWGGGDRREGGTKGLPDLGFGACPGCPADAAGDARNEAGANGDGPSGDGAKPKLDGPGGDGAKPKLDGPKSDGAKPKLDGPKSDGAKPKLDGPKSDDASTLDTRAKD